MSYKNIVLNTAPVVAEPKVALPSPPKPTADTTAKVFEVLSALYEKRKQEYIDNWGEEEWHRTYYSPPIVFPPEEEEDETSEDEEEEEIDVTTMTYEEMDIYDGYV